MCGSPACSTPSSPASGTTRRDSTQRHWRMSRRRCRPPRGPAPPGRRRCSRGRAGSGACGSWTSTARWSWWPWRSGADEFPWWWKWRRCCFGWPTAAMSTRWHTFSNDRARVGCRHRPDLPLPSLVAGAYNRRRLLAPGPEDAAAWQHRHRHVLAVVA
jgi:hypothetical protein